MNRQDFVRNRFFSNPLPAHLTLLAGLSALIYLLVFTWPFPLTRFYSTIPPVDYTKLTGYSPGGLVAYVLAIGSLFGLYLWAIRLTTPVDKQAPAGVATLTPSGGQPPAVGGRFIFFSSALLAAVSVFAYPLTAIDLFIYALRTRGWALYGLNPLAAAPEQLQRGDPWIGLAAEWMNAPSPYGPVWEWLSLGAFHLSGGDFLPHLLALKLLAALAYLGCVWLVYQIMRQLRPAWAIAGTIAFAWSPLVLLESVQNGHNDIVMVFFLLAAIWVLNLPIFESVNKSAPPLPPFASSLIQVALVSVLLALSILVKFVTIMIVPFFLLALAMSQPNWLRRIGVMIISGLLIGAVVVGLMLPIWPGRENWAVLETGSQAGRSLLALLILGLRDSLGLSLAFDVSRNSLLVILATIYLYFLWQTLAKLRQRSPAASLPTLPIWPSFYILCWYVLLAAPVFHAWYLLWFLPLAPLLLPNRRPFIAGAVFSVTALLIIPYFETIRVWYPALLQNQLIGHLIGVPLLIGPPILTLLWPLKLSETGEI